MWLGILTTYLVTVSVALSLAMGIRSYTVSQLPTVEKDSMVLLSVFPRPDEEIIELYGKLESSPEIRASIEKMKPNLAYILPGDYFLTAIVTEENRRFSDDIIERFPEVIEWNRHKFRGGLGKFFRIFFSFFSTLGTIETDYDVERIVFVRVNDHSETPIDAQDLFKLGMQRRPVLIVDLDSDDHQILSIIKTSARHKWGAMPMPTF